MVSAPEFQVLPRREVGQRSAPEAPQIPHQGWEMEQKNRVVPFSLLYSCFHSWLPWQERVSSSLG